VNDLTVKQRRDVEMALRHLNRAMKALSRARLPEPPRSIPDTWEWDLQRGHHAVCEGSVHLIDGLEKLDASDG